MTKTITKIKAALNELDLQQLKTLQKLLAEPDEEKLKAFGGTLDIEIEDEEADEE